MCYMCGMKKNLAGSVIIGGLIVGLLTVVLGACSSDDGGSDVSNADAEVDTEHDTVGDADVDDTPNVDDTAPGDANADAVVGPRDYRRTYTGATEWPAPARHTWVRSIVHLHSTHSHDACDGEPRPDGGYNEPCVDDLRAALCTTRIDVAWLTDHPEHQVEVPFIDALLYDETNNDTLLTNVGGDPIANRISCENGHNVIVRTGTEDRLMPLGLEAYTAADESERARIHNNRDAEAVEAFRSVGALVWQAHAEERSLAEMRAVELDGFEVYQLHANLDPNIREDSLGLDPAAPYADLSAFLFGTTQVHPDLAMLLFLDDNRPSLAHWAHLIQERPVVGTAGTDAHQNVFSSDGGDGERMDSYRRMMSWFSNYVLVEGELSPLAAQQALAAGRVVIGFDILGEIAGFDAWLSVDGTRYEVGSTVNSIATEDVGPQSVSVHVVVPPLTGPSGIPAELSGRLLRADGGEWVPVGEAFEAGTHEIPLDEPGAYRVEVRATGAHLAPYLAEFTDKIAGTSFPWIMSNAFRWNLDSAAD